MINKIISFINEHNTAFSGWGVALFTGIISISTIIVKIIIKACKKKADNVSELMDSTKSDGIYIKSELSKALRIKETMKETFPEYKDFLLVQYGSSVNSDNNLPSDFDFIVLMLGYSKKEVKFMHNKGTTNQISDSTNITHVDVVYRDYLSFLFAASAGMPYENSVIANGKLVHGHEGYFCWLKNITKNILFDRDFLIRRFDEKIIIEKEQYVKCRKEMINFDHDVYYVIRAGYYYITSIIQREKIKAFEKVIIQKDVINLASVRNFYDSFKDPNTRDKYVNLVENLKRNNSFTTISVEDIEMILSNMDLF
ncbi:hypothetical protein SDC9_93677 [bioreactor metagenome]|uniref:Uncharacterized protein n=1 Tax=bioreactor metagenome TaxID=1076179 RepID=A0A645A195_9ZZZZ